MNLVPWRECACGKYSSMATELLLFVASKYTAQLSDQSMKHAFFSKVLFLQSTELFPSVRSSSASLFSLQCSRAGASREGIMSLSDTTYFCRDQRIAVATSTALPSLAHSLGIIMFRRRAYYFSGNKPFRTQHSCRSHTYFFRRQHSSCTGYISFAGNLALGRRPGSFVGNTAVSQVTHCLVGSIASSY